MRRNQLGFTLIEILIALAVFAILATITSSAMYYAFNSRARVSEQADRLNALQLAVALIERDTLQAVNRPVRGNEMHVFPAFIGETKYLELTRGGIANPNSEKKQSALQRIALLCRNGELIRRRWYSLDTTHRNQYHDQTLINNLADCHFAYLNHSLQFLSEWHANAVQQNQREEPFPKAVQVNLTLKDWGNTSMLFIIPGALYG